jgi:hypothetical protein
MKPNAFTDWEGRPIVLIEYTRAGNRWKPHQIFVSNAPKYPAYFDLYDAQWSRARGDLFYHNSGSGGVYINEWPGAKTTRAKLWWDQKAAPNLKTGGGDKVTEADLAGLGFRLIKEPLPLGPLKERNPFQYGTMGCVVYCSRCRDWHSEEDPCDHVFWCEACQGWGGSTPDKSCKHRKPRGRL